MTLALTPSGLSVSTYDELFEARAAQLRGIHGAEINLDPNAPDGNRVGIEAKTRLDYESQTLLVYNMFDPDFATGEMFNRLLKFSGLTLRPATRSQVDVNVTADRTLTLPAGYTVTDDLDQNWKLDTAQVLPAGVTTLTLFAEEFGAVEAASATVTSPSTFVLGVTDVTNPSAAVPGTDEETIEAARQRRRGSLAIPSSSSAAAVFTALASVTDVSHLAVYENDTKLYDAVRDIDPNTLWVVIEGGDVADIADTLVRAKNGGCGLKGGVTQQVFETLTGPSGDFTISHDMKFDRPTGIRTYLRATTASKDGTPVNTTAIRDALATKKYQIAEDAIASELYTLAYSVGANYTILTLEVSNDGVSWAASEVTALDGLRTVALADVTVT